MSVRRIKDKTGLVEKFKLPSRVKPFRIDVYVWATPEDFSRVTGEPLNRSAAMHCGADYGVLYAGAILPPTLMGQIHFVIDKWDDEVLSHELTHALFHRLRLLHPHYEEVNNDIRHEEEVCYEFGEWFYRLRWKMYKLKERWDNV